MLYTSYLNHELGVPFGTSNFKCEALTATALTTGALVAGGASVLSSILGGLFGSSSSSSTNSTNYKIAQMNNEYNSAQLERLIDYNWDMWNADNEYNSASSQVERYLEAGLNPSIMMTSGGNAGTATSMSAPSAAPADTSGTQKPVDYSFIGDAIANGVNAYNSTQLSTSQSDLLDAQAEYQRTKNQYTVAEIIAELDNIKADTWSKEAKANLDTLMRSLNLSTFNSDVAYAQKRNQNLDAQTMLTQAQTNVAIVQAELGYKEMSYFDKSKQYEFAMTAANIQLAYANGNLSLAQAKKAIADTYLSECQAANVNVDTKLKERNYKTAEAIADSLIKEAQVQADYDLYDFNLYKRDNPIYNNGVDSYIGGVGSFFRPIKGLVSGSVGYRFGGKK